MLRFLIAALGALALVPAATAAQPAADVRFATFNASLNRSAAGQLVAHLTTTTNLQARNAAETIQRIRPDVLLINEFDYDATGAALRLFQDNYLSISQNGAQPISYPYRYAAES
ncbi:MAG TPA: endonuclease/exonuclease/phosphatase family protein, partial [Plantibacter sp.]|nr:endonuclease/exonuclease/phosphatase family protein [Plantibacter sp.]